MAARKRPLLYGSRGSGSAIAELGLVKAGVAYVARRPSRWEAH